MVEQVLVGDVPLLGVAGDFGQAELALARRFDELHQLLYAKGGVRPTNAAIEEVAKLLYLRLWTTRAEHEASVNGRPVRDLFARQVPAEQIVDFAKAAFLKANLSAVLGAMDPDGNPQPLWPLDEPFRLANAEVLAAAAGLVDEIVSDDRRAVADPLGTAFDAFLSGRYDHSGGLGTFLTPSSIARGMADIAFGIRDPLATGWDASSPLIADPYCGTGRFLVAAFEAAETVADEGTLASLLDWGLVGADQSSTATAKSAMNLMLYGASAPHVFHVADSVTAPALSKLVGKIQLVLTNPPFGGGKYTDLEGLRRTAQVITSLGSKTNIDPALACAVRAIDLLAPEGVLGIVLPDGIVDGRYFDELLGRSDVSVVANVSLPTSTFALSGTVAKTSAVFLQKRKSVARTVLARAEHVGFLRQAGKAAADPAGSDLPEIVAGIAKALTLDDHPEPLVQVTETPLVASVATHALASLDPSRIDPSALASRGRLEESGGIRLGELLASHRKRPQKAKDGKLAFVSVLHVDALGVVSWPDAERYSPMTPGQVAHSGEVLVSLLNPSKLRAAVVPAMRERIICSTEFGVFEALVDPYAVLGLLYHPDVQAQLKPLGRGTSSSRRRISAHDVLDLVVPRLTAVEMASLGAAIAKAMAEVENGRASLFENYGITHSD